MEYAFHVYNKIAADGASMALDRLLQANLKAKDTKTTGAGTSYVTTFPVSTSLACDLGKLSA